MNGDDHSKIEDLNMMRAFAVGLLSALSILAADAPTVLAQQFQPYYSPADSVVYVLISDHWFRFRDGGARLEQAPMECTYAYYLLAFNGVPGQLYATSTSRPRSSFVSTDYGDTWTPDERPGVRAAANHSFDVGWGGDQPGESWVMTTWGIFLTHDNWETYDSLRPFGYCPALAESVGYFSLAYEPGVVYGYSEQTSTICVSADTGQTWTPGGIVVGASAIRSRTGAVDELWMRGAMDTVMVALDTGRTLVNPVFVPHPPEFPYPWHYTMAPTSHPGEAFLLAELNHWGTPNITDLILYHIRNYGAAVDSFGYRLVDWELSTGAGRPSVPDAIRPAAWPNPFNAFTTIRFTLPRAQRVSLSVYDLLGREVAVLHEGMSEAGEHALSWNAEGLASGLYFARLTSGNSTQTRKLLLVR